MAGVDTTGFTKLTTEEIVTQVNTKCTTAFGQAFDTSPESPDGQIIGILSQFFADHWQMGEAAYNAYNPAMVNDVSLDNIVRLNGIKRIVARPTVVTVQLGGTSGITVPAGSLVSTGDGVKFTLNDTVVLPGETQATAVLSGAITIPAGAVNTISTPIVGWDTVSNEEAGVTGIAKETNPQLRARRERSVIRTGVSTAEAIYAAVADLDLEFIAVIENDTSVVVNGIPPKSFHTIVEGSTEQLIAERIYANKSGGIEAFGSSIVVVNDSKGYPHNIGLSRPTPRNVEVVCTLHRPEGISLDAPDKVQDALVAHIKGLKISENVAWADLFAPATAIAGVKIKSITLAFEGDVQGTVDLELLITERAATSLSLVTIVEI